MSSIDDVALDAPLLRTLVALLDERHVTRAALRLGTTQSATSHGLARLRRALEDPLFVRGPRGVVPTDRAIALGPRARKILEDLDALRLSPGPFDPRALRRSFVLGGADYSELVLLPLLARRLAKEAPNVDLVFRAQSHAIDDDLERGALDLVVGLPQQATPRLLKKTLFHEDFVCLLRRGHPALASPLTVERFASLDHVLVSPAGGATGVVDDVLRARGLTRRVAVRTATFLTAPIVIAQTDCVTTMPRRVAEVMSRGQPLVIVPPPLKIPRFTIALIFHARSKADPASTWLRKTISEIASEV